MSDDASTTATTSTEGGTTTETGTGQQTTTASTGGGTMLGGGQQSGTTTTATTSTGTDAAPPEWAKALPPEMQALVKSKGWTDPGDVLSGYANLEKLLGGSKVAVPGKDAKPEDWERFWDAAGRPKDANGYQIERPKDLPMGYVYNDAMVNEFKDIAHKAGYTPAQVQVGHDFLVAKGLEMFNAQAAQVAREREAGMAMLRKDWGPGFDQKASLALSAVEQFGGEPLKQWFNQTGLGDDAQFIRLFHAIGSALGESKFVAGDGSSAPPTGKAGAKAEIERLSADKNFFADLSGSNGPAAKKLAQEKWDGLNARAAGEEE